MSSVAESDEALLHFLYRAPIGLAQATPDGTVEMMNPLSAQLLMPVAPDGRLDNLFDALRPIAPGLRATVAAFAASSGTICDGLRVAVDGFHPTGPRVYGIHLTKIADGRLMLLLEDATADVERERDDIARRLHDVARRDVVTGLPNRMAVVEMAQVALDNATGQSPPCAALLSIGCDRLHRIGDTLGHDVRDQVIDLMARRLRSVLRPADCVGCAGEIDTIAARAGAGEFIVLLQRIGDLAAATVIAQRLLDSLTKPYRVGMHELQCAVSIGIVPVDAHRSEAAALLHDAALAMAEARQGGGARWMLFESPMRERAQHRAGVETALRQALAADELFVVYQPVLGLRTLDGSPSFEGVEALVRWRHPVRGIVPPIEFIGVAEETGLIDALGLFVLRTACRQFVEWQRVLGDRAPRSLAVNLSRAQLAAPDLPGHVAAIVAETRMPIDRLQLEVTESLAAQDDGVQATLHTLKATGLKLALDDFGTGYSSLSSLHLLPVDTVKIDRSFVTLAESSAHHRVLIEATILVARSLGMQTVAEGIETEGQAAVVRSLGCDKAQGYLFGRPLTAEDLVLWATGR